MPYIKQEDRDKLDKIVELMKEVDIVANGDLNYLMYAYCKRHISPSYNNYKNFIGELNQCATEIERRMLAPYEDEKIIENGDVV
ncbi:MAG: hypothetical protein AB8B73_09690 [Ekhidna sp.]